MKKYRKPFDAEEFRKARCEDNLSYTALAEMFDISVSTVKQHIKDLGLPSKTTEQCTAAKKAGMLKKYGVDHVSKLPGYGERCKETYKQRTGYDHPAHNPEVQAKKKATNLERYGCENPNQNEEVKAKSKATSRERYGCDHALQNKEMYQKWCDNYEAKTGYRNPSQNPDVQKTRTQTFIDTFGVSNPALANYTPEQLKIIESPESMRSFIIDSGCDTIKGLTEYLNISESTVLRYIHSYNLEDVIRYVASSGEEELREWVRSMGIVVERTRMVLAPKEIDIYCQDYNIGIEFNGNYWHSNAKHARNYHLNKSKLAQDKGIRLIHIYEYEWNDPVKQKIIKSMLKIAFGKAENKIYARQCEIREISNKEAKPFNEANHLQGHRNAQITYGLFYNNQLVQLMSFSYDKKKGWWEIVRGCPGSNNVVVGGVSKLFAHFIKEKDPEQIFSYCDFNKFDGKGYEAIGMKFIGYTGPDMKWLMPNGDVVNRRPGKHKELKELAVAQIWGAGSKKYLWTKQDTKQPE